MTQDERAFWERVFFTAFPSCADARTAGMYASSALRELRLASREHARASTFILPTFGAGDVEQAFPCEHGRPGGPQFCIFCLRRRGDRAEERAATLATKLRQIVSNARDEGRADMRSVDEQLIDEARKVLEGAEPGSVEADDADALRGSR